MKTDDTDETINSISSRSRSHPSLEDELLLTLFLSEDSELPILFLSCGRSVVYDPFYIAVVEDDSDTR